MAGSIVVGYDGSAAARAALDEAAKIGHALGLEIVIAFGFGVAPSGGETADHRRLLEERGEELSKEALARLAELGTTGSVAVIVDERPAESLLRVAEERGAEMIVVGTGGEGPVLGSILGSVPYKLVHRSSIPVLVVPAPD